MSLREMTVGRAHGFTLIEVLVAFSILSLTLAALFALMSAGARNTQVAAEYSQAVVLAESKLAQLGESEPLRSGLSAGRFDPAYQWELRVDTVLSREAVPHRDEGWEMLELRLRVWWQSMGQERDLMLSTRRLVGRS